MKSGYSAFIIICTAVILSFSITSAFASDKCTVWDDNDSSVNVRSTPGGEIINQLRNGRVVYASEYGKDDRDRPWAYVSGYYEGEWRNWGWIYMDLLRCE